MKIDQHLIKFPRSVSRMFSNKISLLKAFDNSIGKLSARLLPSASPAKRDDFPPEKILIIRPGGIGDAVLLVPAIQILKQSYPSSKIDILAEKRNASVFDLCPHINQMFHYDRPGELVKALRHSYDIVIDTEQWHRLSAIIARLIRAQVKIGFNTNERRRMFNHAIPYSHNDYEVDSFLRLFSPLGISHGEEIPPPFLQIPFATVGQSEEFLGHIQRPFVTLFPGASIVERQWGGKKFGELAALITGHGIGLVVVGGKEDVAQGEEIVKHGGSNLAGRTSLLETAAVIEKSTLLVSGDSGVLHLAAGLAVPTVGLFGPGIEKKWAPRGAEHRVINHHLDCSPCTRFGTTPPCPHAVACMDGISVAEVWRAVKSTLEQRRPSLKSNSI